jgi:L-ascorbate metabolism protein UlaG (beta-lactamase superfamily)
MRVHVIGHASLLIEAEDVTILMDPIFWDPHYEGTAAMCPQREVTPESLPSYDVVVVSHRHLDHFDIRTLASLDRQCPVLIPERDPLLNDAIHRLGFHDCRALENDRSMAFGRTTLTATPSKAAVRELGLVVRDSSGTLWNQVDTQIDGRIATRIADAYGPIDLLLATWQPLLEGEVLTNGTTSFPHDIYFKMLANVQVVHPRVVVPSACGFKYVGEGAWLNTFVFPATREMFARDVSTLVPDVEVMIANPGDVLELSQGRVALKTGASPFVRTVQDDVAETWFDPTGAVPALSDPNPNAYDEDEMQRAVAEFLEGTLLSVLQESRRRERLAHEYRRLGVVYQLDVVFPSRIRSWSVDFGRDLSLIDGPSPVADIHARIAASLLIDLMTGRTTAGYVYSVGGYRFSHRVHAVAPHGMYKWSPASGNGVLDPLWMAFDLEALFSKYVERDIAAHRIAAQEPT